MIANRFKTNNKSRMKLIENANKSVERDSLYSWIATKGAEEFFEPTAKPAEPCSYSPGSIERIEVYASRLLRGEDLYHEHDETRAATIEQQTILRNSIMDLYRHRKRVW